MRCCDASLADCACTHKPTCGACIALVGENAFIPLAAVNRKNAVVVYLRQINGIGPIGFLNWLSSST